MISCRELTKRFGEVTVVDRLTLEVAKGHICAFLGPNGAGKSTTVKMLTGLLPATSGEATVGGSKVAANSVELKHRMGVLPENLGLFDDLTVEEHMLLTSQVYGVSDAVGRARIEQLLEVLDLKRGRNTFASQCSHGMRKKTALAMALLPNPEVLFLDEPFEAIDPVASKTMRDLLVRASERGITVFLTSHILSTVESIANQFVIIRGGKMVWNSLASGLTTSLEELYFELAERPMAEDLEWLGSVQS